MRKDTNVIRQKQPKAAELTDAELSDVAGGSPQFNPFSITRKIDQASPIFFQA